MTRVQGNLKIVTGAADDVTEVWVRAARARPVTGGWLMTADDHHPVSGGVVDLELLPGACVLVAVTAGEPGEKVEMIVPESGTASLEACIRAAESAGELERNVLDELRLDMAAWVDEARKSVALAQGSEKAAATSADAAKGSATAAAASSKTAAASESSAASSARQAAASASSAKTDAGASSKSATEASSNAVSARESATAAGKSAVAAQESANTSKAAAGEAVAAREATWEFRSTATDARDRAIASADAAGKSAAAAAGSANTAKSGADAASSSATAAGKAATAAKSDADRAASIASSTSWSGDRLTVNGKTSPPLTGPRGLKGERGEPGERGERGEPGYRGVEGWATAPVETVDLLPLMDAEYFSARRAVLTRCGGAVFLNFIDLRAVKDTWGSLMSWDRFPERLKPAEAVWSTLAAESVNDVGRISVNKDGVVYADSLQVGEKYNGAVMWWLPDGAPVPIPRVNEAAWDSITGKPDLPTKAYVDGAVAGKADAAHKHRLADVADMPQWAVIPAANALVMRDNTGRANVSIPLEEGQIANKGYVDSAVQSLAKGAFELRVAPSAPASGTASNVITFVKE